MGLGKFGGKAAKSNSQAQQQNQQSGANQQQNQQFGNNRQNQQQQSNNGQGQGQNQGQGQGQGQNRQTGNNGQQASPGSAGPRINPNEAPEVTAAMREAERNLHDFAAHSQELQKAKEKTLKAEQAAKQAQAEAAAARQQATAAGERRRPPDLNKWLRRQRLKFRPSIKLMCRRNKMSNNYSRPLIMMLSTLMLTNAALFLPETEKSLMKKQPEMQQRQESAKLKTN